MIAESRLGVIGSVIMVLASYTLPVVVQLRYTTVGI
jgi:hypothetical protein